MGDDQCIDEDNNNWGLQAIVHPPPPSMATPTTTYDLLHTPNHSFDVSQVTTFDDDDDDDDDDVGVAAFDVGFSSSNNDALLDELYKPFYLPNNSSSLSFSPQEYESEDPVDGLKMKGCFDEPSPPRKAPPKSVPKYKKRNRKNEHKRVVIEVAAEELCKDKWAWRKYGQKPIKGSPYPRSYYRCSSSKGCLARKQVERSSSKAGTFVVTYTAEHSHGQPTRRNSLAGTIRNKFIIHPPPLPPPAAASPSTSSVAPTTPPRLLVPSVSDPLSSSLSDYNSGTTCNEEEGMEMQKKEEMMMMMTMEENEEEDFFAGLEDLDGLLSQFCYPSSSPSFSFSFSSSSSHDHYNNTSSLPPSMFST